MKGHLFSLVFFVAVQSAAQSTSYSFRFRYEDYSAFANEKCIINGQLLATDPQGIIKLTLANSAFITDVQSADIKKYKVRFPVEGHVLLPKNPTVLVDVFMAKAAGDPSAKLAADANRAQSRAVSEIARKLDEQSTRMYKAVTSLITQKKVERNELAKGRLEYLPLISQALNQYVNEARDFNNAFGKMSLSLTNKSLYAELTEAIYSFNDMYELLNANRNTYEQAVATYWNSKELALKFSNVAGFALDDVARQTIYEMNFTYIDRINRLKLLKNRKEIAAEQADIMKGIGTQSGVINRQLDVLAARVAELNTLLGNFSASTQ